MSTFHHVFVECFGLIVEEEEEEGEEEKMLEACSLFVADYSDATGFDGALFEPQHFEVFFEKCLNELKSSSSSLESRKCVSLTRGVMAVLGTLDRQHGLTSQAKGGFRQLVEVLRSRNDVKEEEDDEEDEDDAFLKSTHVGRVINGVICERLGGWPSKEGHDGGNNVNGDDIDNLRPLTKEEVETIFNDIDWSINPLPKSTILQLDNTCQSSIDSTLSHELLKEHTSIIITTFLSPLSDEDIHAHISLLRLLLHLCQTKDTAQRRVLAPIANRVALDFSIDDNATLHSCASSFLEKLFEIPEIISSEECSALDINGCVRLLSLLDEYNGERHDSSGLLDSLMNVLLGIHSIENEVVVEAIGRCHHGGLGVLEERFLMQFNRARSIYSSSHSFRLLNSVFADERTSRLFGLNNFRVLVEVVVREIRNRESDDAMRIDYLNVLSVIVWSDYFQDTPHRMDEIRKVLSSILEEEEGEGGGMNDSKRVAAATLEAINELNE